MSNAFKITPAGFGWLAQAFSEANAISPFAAFAKDRPEFAERTADDLVTQGVIDREGTLRPEALAALRVLAKADGYFRLRILGTDAPVDKVTYFQGDATCSVDGAEGGFTVTYPAQAQEAGYILEEFTGSSRIINVPFRTSLSPKAAAVFLALVDLGRSRALLALAGEPKPQSFSPKEITDKANSRGSFFSFVRCLQELTGVEALSAAETTAALRELAAQQLVAVADGGYRLAGDALELALTFLIPEYVFHLSYGWMLTPETCEQSECYVIFCGMHNLLCLDTAGGMITIETMSGSDLFTLLVGALSHPPARQQIA